MATFCLASCFHHLDPKPEISRLPFAELPQPVRANDPNLRYAPLQRLDWDKFVIAVGDSNLAVGCKLPYPKWSAFKGAILKIMGIISNAEIEAAVERISVKYVDLIEAETLAEQIGKIDLSVKLGTQNVRDDQIHLRVESAEDDIVHVYTVTTGVSVNLQDGRSLTGVKVDIDSVQDVDSMQLSDFTQTFEPRLEKLKQTNKEKFFSHLRQKAIDEMGPRYE